MQHQEAKKDDVEWDQFFNLLDRAALEFDQNPEKYTANVDERAKLLWENINPEDTMVLPEDDFFREKLIVCLEYIRRSILEELDRRAKKVGKKGAGAIGADDFYPIQFGVFAWLFQHYEKKYGDPNNSKWELWQQYLEKAQRGNDTHYLTQLDSFCHFYRQEKENPNKAQLSDKVISEDKNLTEIAEKVVVDIRHLLSNLSEPLTMHFPFSNNLIHFLNAHATLPAIYQLDIAIQALQLIQDLHLKGLSHNDICRSCFGYDVAKQKLFLFSNLKQKPSKDFQDDFEQLDEFFDALFSVDCRISLPPEIRQQFNKFYSAQPDNNLLEDTINLLKQEREKLIPVTHQSIGILDPEEYRNSNESQKKAILTALKAVDKILLLEKNQAACFDVRKELFNKNFLIENNRDSNKEIKELNNPAELKQNFNEEKIVALKSYFHITTDANNTADGVLIAKPGMSVAEYKNSMWLNEVHRKKIIDVLQSEVDRLVKKYVNAKEEQQLIAVSRANKLLNLQKRLAEKKPILYSTLFDQLAKLQSQMKSTRIAGSIFGPGTSSTGKEKIGKLIKEIRLKKK